MRTTYNHESLDRHGISEQEVDEVYSTGKDFDMSSSTNGNDRIMVVGWTSFGRLLEIGIEYLTNTDEYIFHAMDATRYYSELFNKDRR